MKPILVLYATKEGHTRRIAEHIAATLRARDQAAEVIDVTCFSFRRRIHAVARGR